MEDWKSGMANSLSLYGAVHREWFTMNGSGFGKIIKGKIIYSS